jgi:hypothetical protein
MWETFSQRKKAEARAGQPDVFQYDSLPEQFRTQVVYIWEDALGAYYDPRSDGPFHTRIASPSNSIWQWIHGILVRERGEFMLGDKPLADPKQQCQRFLLTADIDGALDIIELSFYAIQKKAARFGPHEIHSAQITLKPPAAIDELNGRFKQHGIGYQYADGKLLRVDSQFIHSEAVKPAIALLNSAGFSGPVDEFMKAFEHHRHGRSKEAIAEALKAFESTMKAICTKRNWAVAAPGTAKPLIDAIMKNGLVPANLANHFSGLRSAMESGLPTLSNSTSRHGQGATPTVVPPHFAAYALHLAASNIVFLVEAHNCMP